MLKKGSIMTRKNLFSTKILGYYSFIFIYYIILQHFVVVIQLLFITLFWSHFNHADLWRRKTEMALSVWYWNIYIF